MNAEQLKRIMPYATLANIRKYLPFLNELMPKFDIDTPLRKAHFIAQIAHESGSFRYVKELASGKAYDTGILAKRLGNTPEADGDGQLYKGRGLIQLTGLTNYRLFAQFLKYNPNVVDHPERVEEPRLAVMAACWYWQRNNINSLADKDDITAVTRKVNGGTNGINDSKFFLERAKKEDL